MASVQQAINAVGSFQFLAVDGDDVISDGDVHSGRGERRVKVGIPALRMINFGDFVAAVFDGEVGAEQASAGCGDGRHVASADIGVADGDFGAHHVDQVIQVGAMHGVRQKLAVDFFHAGPVGSMHVGDVEIVALIAPAFVEDLFELLFRLQVHAQRCVEPARSRGRDHAIGVDQEKRRSGGSIGSGSRVHVHRHRRLRRDKPVCGRRRSRRRLGLLS